jgi:uncharacterized protein (DUF1800 family)
MLTRAAHPVRRLLFAIIVGIIAGAGVPSGTARTAVPDHPDDRTIIHVLNRIGYGPTPGDVERVRRIGLARYIDQQLAPEKLADTAMASRLAGFRTLQEGSRQIAEDYFLPVLMARRHARQSQGELADEARGRAADRAPRTPGERAALMQEREVLAELGAQKVLRAAYSERQLEAVMVDFWFNHFNVFAGKGPTRIYLTEYERDSIRPHVLGRFRQLLGATAESPAMLFYLDNWQSSAPQGARTAGRRAVRAPAATGAPAMQRARGINENYARELMELHTLGVAGGYTQKDVQEVARAFTGWTITTPRQGGSFRYEPRMHDDGEKVVLGHRFPAGGGRNDGERVLDILAAHPATARFVALKLARRFVADDPPATLVDRAASKFRDTGGDLREVVRTILTSPEFFAAAAYRAKVKTPFEFITSAVRATGSDAGNARPLVQALRDLGMPAYYCQPPTGYADRAEAWVNAGALLNRMNFALSLTEGNLRGGHARSVHASAAAAEASADTLVRDVLGGDISEPTRSTVASASGSSQAVALLLGSPEFQRR